jgi:hypothetical protein
MMEVTENQDRRACNIIWAAARKYDFTPDYKAYKEDGSADLYWNYIIGASRFEFDYKKIEPIFLSFQTYEEADVYEGLLWLGLENCIYEKEVATRPVLRFLRLSYAKEIVSGSDIAHCNNLYELMLYAHFAKVLGVSYKLDSYNTQLLEELEFPGSTNTEDIVNKANILFQKWFQISTTVYKKKREIKFPVILGKQRKNKNNNRFRKYGHRIFDHPKNIYGGSLVGQQDPRQLPLTKMTDSELKLFMESKFGKSIFNESKDKKIDKLLCSGNHEGCHLLITKGDKTGRNALINNGFEALQKQREAAQVQRNRDYYQENIVSNTIIINRLSNKISNSVLLYLQSSPIKSNTGILDASSVWKAVRLNDNKVFTREDNNNLGNVSVDILLDASTSQQNRQEIISTQGRIIAESLVRCHIPCRVMSFCSMTGYTILHVYKEYNDSGHIDRIMEYVSNGCNRDGLAIRAASYLLSESLYEHKLLIILSDVKPNDVRKMAGKDGEELVNYESRAAVYDTAYEVRRARANGISVICVFTGEDKDIESAKIVYGRDFTRIRSMDYFADTVGKLIQNQIKIL